MDLEQRIERLQQMMRAYEGTQHTVVGFGVQQGPTHVIGSNANASKDPYDDMIFEIGSITKVFSAILLCLLVEEGKVDPRAPLSEIADELSIVPNWITPERLTSHTSGLPRIHMPIWKTLVKPLPKDPYAEFTRADLLAWLRNWSDKAQDSTTRYAYSNLGIGLLGEAIALKEGKPFVDLLAERVIAPLGLKDTTSRLNMEQYGRFVQPRSTRGATVKPWTFQAIAAAGCLRSSARDLAQFSHRIIQALNAPETTLDHAICQSVKPIFGLGPRGGMEPVAQCSGWLSIKFSKSNPGFLYHDGGTAGSICALYICPEKGEALGVLSNNGIAVNLWANTKLSWSNQLRQAHDYFLAI